MEGITKRVADAKEHTKHAAKTPFARAASLQRGLELFLDALSSGSVEGICPGEARFRGRRLRGPWQWHHRRPHQLSP
jgi:hypothetical protein